MWGLRRGLKEAQGHIDLSAHETATKAITMIEQHTQNCDRREAERARRDDQFRTEYASDVAEVKGSIKDVHSRVSGLRSGMWGLIITVGGAVIVGLVSLVFWLLTNGGTLENKSNVIVITPEIMEQLKK